MFVAYDRVRCWMILPFFPSNQTSNPFPWLPANVTSHTQTTSKQPIALQVKIHKIESITNQTSNKTSYKINSYNKSNRRMMRELEFFLHKIQSKLTNVHSHHPALFLLSGHGHWRVGWRSKPYSQRPRKPRTNPGHKKTSPSHAQLIVWRLREPQNEQNRGQNAPGSADPRLILTSWRQC